MNPAQRRQIAVRQARDDDAVNRPAPVMEQRAYDEGQPVFLEGDPGDGMHFIVSGSVRIEKQTGATPAARKTLAILEPGDYFGEMSLIEDGPRSADALAHIACKVYELTRERLDQVMFTDKELAYVILWTFVRTLSARLRETNDKIRAFFALSSFGPR